MTVSAPAAITAQLAQGQLNVALSSIKASAEAAKQVANILDEAIQNVPTSSLGSSVNIRA